MKEELTQQTDKQQSQQLLTAVTFTSYKNDSYKKKTSKRYNKFTYPTCVCDSQTI